MDGWDDGRGWEGHKRTAEMLHLQVEGGSASAEKRGRLSRNSPTEGRKRELTRKKRYKEVISRKVSIKKSRPQNLKNGK